MKFTFWASLAFVAYTYLGYPLWLYLLALWKPKTVRKANILPSVSIVMAAHNEGAVLLGKLRNLAALNYPPESLEIVVASDGSSDATNQILKEQSSERVIPVICAVQQGKAAALTQAIAVSKGEIVVFVDARQMVEPEALRVLVSNFGDSEVGCVSGELMLGNLGNSPINLGHYWNIEKKIRQWEATSGSTVGATGAFYAIRRELLPEIPAGMILDDVYIPMHAARSSRVVFEPDARVWDAHSATRVEFSRKVRTLSGNYQLIQLAPWMITYSNPILLNFVSHKLFRLLVPFALLLMLTVGFSLSHLFYRATALSLVACALLGTIFSLSSRFGILARAGN